MRTIIAGSRKINGNEARGRVERAIALSGIVPTVVLSGGCRGIDKAGEYWARSRGITVETYPALWSVHGNAAGPIRNRQMAEAADALVAIPDALSRGTVDMIDQARELGLRVFVLEPGA